MSIKLTSDEIDVLNEVLKEIVLDGDFTMFDTHYNFLASKYTNSDNTVDTLKLASILKINKQNNVYDNLVDFLLDKQFVEVVNPSGNIYKLTSEGKVLASYGNVKEYFDSFYRCKHSYNIQHLSEMMPYIPPFGEFSCKSFLPNFESEFEQEEPLAWIFPGKRILLGPKAERRRLTQRIIELHETEIKNNAVAQKLVYNGFAIRRHDIGGDDQYFQLTDNGRKLKESGSFEEYEKHIEQEKNKEIAKERRDKLQSRINLWIAIGAIVASVYYLLDLTLNHNILSFTIPIIQIGFISMVFIFGVVGGLMINLIIKVIRNMKS